ncbi:MAG: RcnB family protein [Mangrovicoccus sp.]
MMKPLIAGALAICLAQPVLANPPQKGGKNAPPGHSQGNGTPPGLAKKPGNMPPGQYEKMSGGRYIEDYRRYRLPEPPRGQGYYIKDDQIYRVMRDTMAVVAAVGVIADVLK